ncbi:MAG: phosphatase PAP2 family protein, partial [Ignavibacteria bacterium]|nr:phosphatase PAP2 family protein [Ignavibacteria bacterium]
KLSFPSGHTTVAFAVSAVLAERINTWWARVGLYSLAAATAYSRIYDNKHWLSDVVLGSIIGFGSGYFTVHRENERGKKKTNISDKMNFNFSLSGINLVYKF